MHVLGRLSLTLVIAFVVGGCSALSPFVVSSPADTEALPDDAFPDVLAVELRPSGERTYDVTVTISSPYDTPARYADGWRVLDPSGSVLGTHTLLHDLANEQPFTRTQRGLRIPEGISEVTVEGRDQVHGFGGATVTVEVPA